MKQAHNKHVRTCSNCNQTEMQIKIMPLIKLIITEDSDRN